MANRQGFQRRRSAFHEKPRTPPYTKQTSQNWVWVPKIPSWEREFCSKVGLFTWENFLETKKLTKFTPKVLEWNDSAGEEAFHRSKNRFFTTINGGGAQDDEEGDDVMRILTLTRLNGMIRKLEPVSSLHWDIPPSLTKVVMMKKKMGKVSMCRITITSGLKISSPLDGIMKLKNSRRAGF